jgi:integrase
VTAVTRCGPKNRKKNRKRSPRPLLTFLALAGRTHSARKFLARRVLRIASEWGELGKVPLVKMLPGERHRERVVSLEEEARYLAAAREPLASVAAVLVDTGMRPEECYRLRWDSVGWANGRNGTVLITHGKTKAARRVLPMSPKVRAVLEERWQRAGNPQEGWIWAAPTKSGHIEPSSLKKQHRGAVRLSGVRPFVLYSLRHTFLTRLGESGCDAWTLARIAGHSSITISASICASIRGCRTLCH